MTARWCQSTRPAWSALRLGRLVDPVDATGAVLRAVGDPRQLTAPGQPGDLFDVLVQTLPHATAQMTEVLCFVAGFVSARPADEPAVQAVCHGIVDGLTNFYDQDREQQLERLRLAFRTPALQPRMRQQQAHWAGELAEILAHRLGAHPDDLEIRAIAAAIAAAVWVATEHWQAQDGRGALSTLIDRALDTVLGGPSHGHGGTVGTARRGRETCPLTAPHAG